ncbi:enoyl-CoA hydratase/isomerase family protein [Undibacterium terreum]|uniref:Short-chain-enoyl-CoA hydratase n=1 Tax=Undibacterium terreum TaxID=1224302 RepID=A0A916XM54_9BURK|nr:enoyl-CoA hydratase-related protein [Undibacterium terreum]GGC86035.1 short-chain-enoyl-CoA hydratase [Undibacterium terreum]
MSDFMYLQYEKKGNIACITLDNPSAMNALSQNVIIELDRAFDQIGTDTCISGVILTGRGKAFVAGADITDLSAVDSVQAEQFTYFGQRLFNKIESLGKPVIAAVNGYAFGGGCELAMACTLRIASDHAKFGQPEVKLGVIPGFGGTQRLPRIVGIGRAMQLILTGGVIDAEEALRIGLINEIVDSDKLIARAEEILSQISANAPIAVRLAMEAVNRSRDTTVSDGLAIERALFSVCAGTQDKREGTSAFLSKRPPQFSGK